MRARPRQPPRNVCKLYAHTKRTLGRRGRIRSSSRWALRKMSGSGQKNGNKTPPTPFLLSSPSSCVYGRTEEANLLTHKLIDEAVTVFSF